MTLAAIHSLFAFRAFFSSGAEQQSVSQRSLRSKSGLDTVWNERLKWIHFLPHQYVHPAMSCVSACSLAKSSVRPTLAFTSCFSSVSSQERPTRGGTSSPSGFGAVE